MAHTSVARALLSAALLLLLGNGALAREQVPNTGQLTFMDNVWSIDYTITGVEMVSLETPELNDQKFSAQATAPVVTIQGKIRMSAVAKCRNEFAVAIISGTAETDAQGNRFGRAEYVANGPTWQWQGSVDARNSETKLTDSAPFSFNIPVPGYDAKAGVKEIYFQLWLDTRQYNYRYGEPDDYQANWARLKGTIAIPEDLELPPTLTISNGGQLDPLRIKLKLMDNATSPPQPMKNTIIRVKAPVPGKTASLIAGAFSRADWSLSGYFMSKTKCPNCEWKQAGSQFTSDIYYYLKDPTQPIEVLTDDQGQAELLFFLDLPALGAGVPRRDRALKIPITAEYTSTASAAPGKALAEAKLDVSLNHLGYIVSVTYVQPQEWEAWGGLGEVRPAEHNTGEYALDSYHKDTGTGLPYADVRGADRAKISAATQLVAPGGFDGGYGVAGGSLELQPAAPGEPLQPGMLFAYGDRVTLDARGLLRYKSSDPQDPASQIYAKPGWVWVKVKFFDGLKAKVGVSGVCGQHQLIFGQTPEDTGWVPTDQAFIYWAGREAVEHVVSKFIPVYGQIDMACDIAGYISWANHGEPAYIRVESDIVVNRGDDGSATVTVREGHPAVVTRATGFAGVKAVTGETAVISTGNQVSVAKSSAAQSSYADALLGGMLNGPDNSTGLKPVEVDVNAASTTTPAVYVDVAGEMPLYEDEAGDVPLYEDEAGDVPLSGLDYSGAAAGGTDYRFDEFSLAVPAGWEYRAEGEDSFASFGNDDLGLYMVVIRAPIDAATFLEMLETDSGEAIRLTAAGRPARWIPLYEDGEEYGALLCFDTPLASGDTLLVNFISATELWEGLGDFVIQLVDGMRFAN